MGVPGFIGDYAGIGPGTKYIALYGAAIIVILVIWFTWRETKTKLSLSNCRGFIEIRASGINCGFTPGT